MISMSSCRAEAAEHLRRVVVSCSKSALKAGNISSCISFDNPRNSYTELLKDFDKITKNFGYEDFMGAVDLIIKPAEAVLKLMRS